MDWPILISASVTPGAFSAKAERLARSVAVAALALRNVRRENIVSLPSILSRAVDRDAIALSLSDQAGGAFPRRRKAPKPTRQVSRSARRAQRRGVHDDNEQ